MKVLENDPIAVPTSLISSLSDHIDHVQCFRGKWSIIKSKLSNLQTQLVDLSDFPASCSNSLCIDLLSSVSTTLADAVSLSQRCRRGDLTEGKLRTQSEIDAVSAKLNRHVKDCEVLIKNGFLEDGGGSGTGSGSSKKEAVRVETRNLMTRLQIGSTTESKNSAMDSLVALLQADDKNVMIAVAQGVVQVLVRLLDSSCVEMKEKAVAAISRVSMVDSSKHVLMAEGLLLLNHLLRVLESGSGFAKERACLALQGLSFSKENARAIGSRGGISALLGICQGGTPGSQAFAAGALRNLSAFSEIKENFMEENAVFVLIGLAYSGTSSAQENAIGSLCNLVIDDESLKLLIFKEGIIECLQSFWDSGPPLRSLEVAVELVIQLTSCTLAAETLVAEGFICRILGVLDCGVLGVRIAAARAVHELGYSSKTRKEIGECGCIGSLIRMLDGKAVEEKQAAARALSLLMLCKDNRRIFQKDERGIISVVQLLDPLLLNLDKIYPVSILASLLHSKKCRRQMLAAGASLHLHKLVEMDVHGAKKLLDSLGKGKIWGVFARP